MTSPLEPKTDFELAEEIVIDNLDALKVLSDPLRLQILELLVERGTVKQVAEALNLPPTKLYYHITQLEKHNLVVLVDTRVVSGIIEKHYQTAAKTFRVAKGLLSPGTPGGSESIEITLNSVIDDTRADLFQSLQDGAIVLDETPDDDELDPCGLSFASGRFILTEAQVVEFRTKVHDLMTEYMKVSEANHEAKLDNTSRLRYLYAIFPTSRPQLERKSDDND